MKRLNVVFAFLPVLIVSGSLLISCKNSGAKTDSGQVDLSGSDPISEWREENRTGISDETGLLKSWPETGPELIWTATGLPKGFSSVSIGNNTIYITGQDGDNDALVAIDNTGKVKWQTAYGRTWKESFPDSRCTPTVEGNRVYVTSGYGDVACIDGDSGSIIWSQKASENNKGKYGPWGIAESLLIDGDKIYFSPGGPQTMTIALDKATGNILWKSRSINDGAAYASPILVDFGGKKILIGVALRNVFGIDVSDGNLLWNISHLVIIDSTKSVATWPEAPQIKTVTPLYNNGKIFITGGYNHGCAMLSLEDEGNSIKVDWTSEVLDVHHGGVVMIDGYIYGSNWIDNKDGNWCCLEWSTGKVMWEEHWKCKGSIISAEGLLYIYEEEKGFVGLVNPNPGKFDLLSSFQVKSGSGPHWAHPVIHNGVLFIRHGDALMAYAISRKE